MISYPYSYTQTYSYTPFFAVVLPIIALLIIIAGGLALYFLFVRKPNHFQGTVAKLHDVLNFRTFFTEKLIRLLYCITVVAIVVYSVILLFSHFFTALLLFVIGNLAARIVYEYALLLLVLCRNTQEINRKMGLLPAEPQVPPTAPQQPPVPPVHPHAAAPQTPVPPQPPAAPQAPVAPQPEQPAAPQTPVPPQQQPPQQQPPQP